jgi:hypothetical protein
VRSWQDAALRRSRYGAGAVDHEQLVPRP